MTKFILCCVSIRPLSEEFHRSLNELLTQYKVHSQKHIHLSSQGLWAMDLPLDFQSPEVAERIKFDLVSLSDRYSVDMALLPDHPIRSNRRLIVFDMDSTLIQHEVIDEMALSHGVGEKVRQITEKAMQGEINFDQSLEQRIALLKGFPKEKMELILKSLKLTPGAETLIQTAKARGFKTAIVSGGFKFFAEKIRERLNIDYAFANELDWNGNKLSGKLTGTIVNAEYKAFMIEELARMENITIEEVVAIGDGANDIPMLLKAGLGIAFHAKEKVRLMTRHQLNHSSMEAIIYFLGISGSDPYEDL